MILKSKSITFKDQAKSLFYKTTRLTISTKLLLKENLTKRKNLKNL